MAEILLGAFAFLLNAYLGLAVYIKNPKSWTNRFFILLVIVLNTYIVVNPISLHPPLGTPANQLFWIDIVMAVCSFIGPVLFLLAHTFPHNEIKLHKPYLIGTLVMMMVAVFAGLFGFMFTSISYPAGQPVPTPGVVGMPIFFIDFIGFVILSFIVIIKKYIGAKGDEKTRVGYFLGGIIATFTFMALVTVLSVVIFHTSALIFLGPISPIILMSVIAFAIIRHHFLDIKLVVSRIVSFITLLIFLAGIYSVVLLLIVSRFIPISFNLFIAFGILIAITALSFQPLEQLIRRITNRLFFVGFYDSDALLSKLTQIMVSTIDLDDMTRQMLKTLTTDMNISRGAFLIVREHTIVNVFGTGYTERKLAVPELEKLSHNLTAGATHIIFEDLEEGPTKQLFRTLDISVVIPIHVERREIALLVLGEKKSGETYYERDLELLGTFASSAGVAIDDAQSYAEIKEFSKELERRVEDRTRELKKTQERELAEAKNVARLKDEFVFIAAHELKTPIAAIRGFLQMVSKTPVKFPRDVKENLNEINSASDILNQLINDLLEIARSESGTIKVSVAPTDVLPIVKSVIGELSSLARKQKVRVKLAPEGKIPQALVDPDKAREIIMNLVSNGIKYNKPHGTLTVGVFREKSHVVMEFKDTGYGVPKDQQKHIFQKFFRVHEKGTQEVLGTGLGLFIVRMLCDKMGGKVIFKSAEGRGSTFTVSFPAAKD